MIRADALISPDDPRTDLGQNASMLRGMVATAGLGLLVACAPSPRAEPPATPAPGTVEQPAPAPDDSAAAGLTVHAVVRAKQRTFLILGPAEAPDVSHIRTTSFKGGGKLLEADLRRLEPAERVPVTVVSESESACIGMAKTRLRLAFEALPPDAPHWSEALEIDGCGPPATERVVRGLGGEHPDASWVGSTETMLIDGRPASFDDESFAQHSVGLGTRFQGLPLDFVVQSSFSGEQTLTVVKDGSTIARYRDVLGVEGALRAGAHWYVALASWGWGTTVEVVGDRVLLRSGTLEADRAPDLGAPVEPPSDVPDVTLLTDRERSLDLLLPATPHAIPAGPLHWRRISLVAHLYARPQSLSRPLDFTLVGPRQACAASVRRQRLVGLTTSSRFEDHGGPSPYGPDRWMLDLPIEGCPLDGRSTYLVLPKTSEETEWIPAPSPKSRRSGHFDVDRWTFPRSGLILESRVEVVPGALRHTRSSSRKILSVSRHGKKLGAYPGVAPTATVRVGHKWYLLLGGADYASLPLHVLELTKNGLVVRWGDLKPRGS